MKKAVIILALAVLIATRCVKTQKNEKQLAEKTLETKQDRNAWESADALKDALQDRYGCECETVDADEWEGGSPAYFLYGNTKSEEPNIHVEMAYDKGTNRVIYMEWYFDPETTTAKDREEAVCTVLGDPDDIRKTSELLNIDPLPDYEKAELSDCTLYVMTIEEDGYTTFNVQFTDIHKKIRLEAAGFIREEENRFLVKKSSKRCH